VCYSCCCAAVFLQSCLRICKLDHKAVNSCLRPVSHPLLAAPQAPCFGCAYCSRAHSKNSKQQLQHSSSSSPRCSFRNCSSSSAQVFGQGARPAVYASHRTWPRCIGEVGHVRRRLQHMLRPQHKWYQHL
jgi:hypothetical protein